MIPSPTQGVWNIGILPVRAYALCILVGILVAVRMGDRRWQARGGRVGAVLDIAAWAVPFGIVGGRLYHVATSWQLYFGAGGHPIQALYIWEGGLGIWGAVALGALGAWIGCRRAGIPLPPMADALAPGIVIAQGIGRWGNWFNNELYGGHTDLPWGLRIYKWDQSAGHALPNTAHPALEPGGPFHPTFLYESIWDLGVGGLLLWADRRWRIGHGRLFALYVLLYTVGRGWIEALRVDRANSILGLRLNLWTSLLVGLGALVYLVVSTRLRPGREDDDEVAGDPASGPVTDADAELDDEFEGSDQADDDVDEDDEPDDDIPDDEAPDDEAPDDEPDDDESDDDESDDDEAPDDPDPEHGDGPDRVEGDQKDRGQDRSDVATRRRRVVAEKIEPPRP